MLRNDVNDPKLQDHYRLQQALLLIQYQDTLIAAKDTDLLEEREYSKTLRTAIQTAINQTNDLHRTLSKSDRHYY